MTTEGKSGIIITETKRKGEFEKMTWLEVWAAFQVIGGIVGIVALIGVIIYAIYLNRGK